MFKNVNLSSRGGKLLFALVSCSALVLFMISAGPTGLVHASDHDDGETELKGRSLNITDIYFFKEIDQDPTAPDTSMIVIMNVNPRSVARQSYVFSNQARYEMKFTRVGTDSSTAPTGREDVVLRFAFGERTSVDSQAITVTGIFDGSTHTATTRSDGGGTIWTTSIQGDSSPVNNPVTLGNHNITVFAGLREDPFFFDVEQYFRVRAGLGAAANIPYFVGSPQGVGFRSPDAAVDFAAGYNVNTIVVRVPYGLLAGGQDIRVFDYWATISI